MKGLTAIQGKIFEGERACFASRKAFFLDCVFRNGESPLKESRRIALDGCSFGWKYPLWYCKDADVKNTEWLESARSGVWYTKRLYVKDCRIGAPKQFRRCRDLTVEDCDIPLAQETLWSCRDVTLKKVNAVGDYFGMNSRGVHMENVRIDGNYCFDGGSDITAENCVFNSKDAFWNCKNVTLKNCTIIGEYLGWNTRNFTLIDCKIESHQGLCYIDGLTLERCELNDTDLAFEFCSRIDADILTKVDSIKNPSGGRIRCRGVGELILDEKYIDPAATVIEVDYEG